MNLYKISYRVIGIIVIVLGICMLPFYRNLMDEVPNINNLNLIFMLFVLNTAISYFYAYKKSLIICNQKKFITTIIKYMAYFFYECNANYNISSNEKLHFVFDMPNNIYFD